MSVNRNDACPCGSGKKYKKCCLDQGQQRSPIASKPQLPDIEQSITTIITHCERGNLLDATRLCKTLLDAYPNNPRILYTTARVMFWNGMRDTSLTLLSKAIEIEPNNAAHFALMADIFLTQQQPWPAFQAISKAIELEPNEPAHAHFKAVLILNTINSYNKDEAVGTLRSLIKQHPTYLKAYESLYFVLDERRLYDEAAAVYQQLLAQNPPAENILPFLRLSPKNYCSREEITQQRAMLEQNMERLAACNVTLSPPPNLRNVMFPLTYHGMNNRPLLEKMSALYRKLFPAINMFDPRVSSRTVGEVIKIGFISSFFTDDHVVMTLLREFIRAFATDSRYKTIMFDVGSKGASCSLLKEKNIIRVAMPDNLTDTTYHLITEQECDVLIYLDIGMDATTYLLAFARLAPIQMCFNGHPITTGISTMDYYVSCTAWEGPNAQDYYTEKLILLDPLLGNVEPSILPAQHYSRKDVGFPEEGTIYACPVTSFKIHPDFYAVVIKILQRDPKGIAVFFQYSGIADEVILAHFRNLAPEESKRVIFVPWLSSEQFLPAMALCDVIIDSFHFSLSTTMFKLLAVGTPVVTWTGEFMHGRSATGLYRMMGITELIAKDWDDYVEIALRLGNDKAFNQAMRKKILATNSVIYGDKGGAAEFKQVLENLIDKNKK